MPPRKKIEPTARQQELQDTLARAHLELEAAKVIADELGERFDFLGKTYVPQTTIVKPGDWEDVDMWESSDDC